MREIKFRGRDFSGNWWQGFPVIGEKNAYLCTAKGSRVLMPAVYVEPNTIGQFTGVYARNKTEIYEGDIISLVDMMGDMEGGQNRKGVVKWDSTRLAFVIDFNDMWDDHPVLFEDVDCDFSFYSHVIGNIFDNPELLGLPKE